MECPQTPLSMSLGLAGSLQAQLALEIVIQVGPEGRAVSTLSRGRAGQKNRPCSSGERW